MITLRVYCIMGLVTIVTRLGSLSQENLRNCTILGLIAMTELAKAALNAFRSGDYQRAMELSMPLAEAGDPEFQCIVASFYHLGLGVAIDIEEAVKWYLKSSKQGYGVASNNLAGMILAGQWGDGSRVEAEKWYQKAREQGFEHTPYSIDYLDEVI
jgi:TPR repeat protein